MPWMHTGKASLKCGGSVSFFGSCAQADEKVILVNILGLGYSEDALNYSELFGSKSIDDDVESCLWKGLVNLTASRGLSAKVIECRICSLPCESARNVIVQLPYTMDGPDLLEMVAACADSALDEARQSFKKRLDDLGIVPDDDEL